MIPTPLRSALALLAAAAPALASAGNGDAVPYLLLDCESPFEDISVSATRSAAGLPVTVPMGMDFTYFGTTYSQIGISEFGYVGFTGADLEVGSPVPIPDPGDPRNFIAPLWIFDPDEAQAGFLNVFWELRGTAPNRRFIVQWVLGEVPVSTGELSWEVLLFEDGSFDFRYQSFVSPPEGVGVTGIEGPQDHGIPILDVNLQEDCFRFLPIVDDEPVDLACEEFDRFEDLTPNDTLTLITSQHNPQQEQGYLWVNAVTPANQPVAADALIGQTLVVDGLEALQYATNAVDYRAAVEAGALTDVDADGVRDLDGLEYEKTAGEILVPRFLGSDPQRQTRGELVLIGLSGGSQFTTTADFLVYNDDEDAFSASYTFFCWEKVHTLDISNVFSNQWLKDFSGQNPSKGLGQLEYGWFRVNGGVASSSFFSLVDPALYAVYVERIGGTAAADLPFEDCTQSGHLLPRLVSGDNSETNGAPSDEDCGERLSRRHPASLLLYPEFDNRSGVATVVTVTNTSPTDDVRAHFVYIGRFGN